VLTGKTTQQAQQRQKELADATDESTRAIIKQVYAQEDLQKATDATLDFQMQMLELQGDAGSAELLKLQRQIDAKRKLADGWTQSQIDQLYTVQDAAKASRKALDEARTAADRAMGNLRKSVDAQKQVVQETINNVKSIVDTLGNAIKDLRGSAVPQAMAAQANAFIDNALSNAIATGYLPDVDDLSDAIASVRTGIDEQVYVSEVDAQFNKLVLAGKLSALEAIAKPQLTTAEKQLADLDALVTNAQAQIDALNGVNNSVLSVADAVSAVEAAIANLAAASGGAGGGSSAGNPDAAARQAAIDAHSAGWNGDVWLRAPTEAQAKAAGYDSLADLTKAAAFKEQVPSSTPNLAQDYMRDLVSSGTYGLAQTFYGFESAVLSLEQVLLASELWTNSGGENTFTPEELAQISAAGKVKLPGYDIGTNYVPHDGPAYLHEGEAVVPKAYNPAAGGMANNNNARLESLVEGLTKEVQRLQAIVNDGNKEATRTADAVNGRPEQPMLVETV